MAGERKLRPVRAPRETADDPVEGESSLGVGPNMKSRSDIIVLQPKALEEASGRTKPSVDDTVDAMDFEN